jgi:hypothetical protein
MESKLSPRSIELIPAHDGIPNQEHTMNATRELPDHYAELHHIHLIKNRGIALWLNLAGIGLFLVFGVWFARTSIRLRPDFWVDGLPVIVGSEILAFILAFIAMLILHEGVHGVLFWLYSGQRPHFGLRWGYAYASAPDWYFTRNQFLVIALGPLVLISLFGILLMRLVPLGWLPTLLFLMIMNGAGSAADMYTMVTCLYYPSDILVNDKGDEFSIHGDKAMLPQLPEKKS